MTDVKAVLFKCFFLLDENFFNDFIENIDKRIVFQKYGLFFSIIFGLRFGDYSLYIHGPYNTTMADIGYEFANKNLINKYNSLIQTIKFSPNAVNIVNILKENLSTDNVKFLEVFSTFFYLVNCKKISQPEALIKTKEIKKDIIKENNICLNHITNTYKFLLKNINELASDTILHY